MRGATRDCGGEGGGGGDRDSVLGHMNSILVFAYKLFCFFSFWAWGAENCAEQQAVRLTPCERTRSSSYIMCTAYVHTGKWVLLCDGALQRSSVCRAPGPHCHLATVGHRIPPGYARNTMPT